MTKERTVKVKAGETWDSLAARELGNKTLADELAGANGANALAAPLEGAEIRIPGTVAETEDSEKKKSGKAAGPEH